MRTRLPGLLLLGSALTTLTAQDPAKRMQAARAQWSLGNYPAALEQLIELRKSPQGAALHREIALLTGELYPVHEVAADGRAPQISANGRFGSYQAPQERRSRQPALWRVVSLQPPFATLAELRARTCAFAEDNQQAWFVDPDRESLLWIDLQTGQQGSQPVDAGPVVGVAVGAEDVFALVNREEGTGLIAISRDQPATEPRSIPAAKGFKTNLQRMAGDRYLVYQDSERDPLAGGGRRRWPGASSSTGSFAVVDQHSGRNESYSGSRPTLAQQATTLAYLTADDEQTNSIHVLTLPEDGRGKPRSREVYRHAGPIRAMALSADGSTLVFQARADDNWELFSVPTDKRSAKASRVTREIQHDLDPAFLDPQTVMAQIGESRHRRAYSHDLATGQRTRLFHNNTIRTIAPQYAWTASADGQRVLILAERDGNTVSPDRSIYLVDRSQEIDEEQLLQRMRQQLAGEQALRALGEAMFTPIDGDVRRVTESVAVARVKHVQQQLADCGSRHLTSPGNKKAQERLAAMFASYGYEPELQKLGSRGQRRSVMGSGGSCNVIARLEGTVHPELIYVLGSHYDSVARGPGADDNGSGTAVTMEAARVLADHPMPATILFVAFTGEESGLMGSREFVRVAAEEGLQVIGALNNDMLGWANDAHIDNTIRYSNPGIRDVQHNAALRYSKLITYDALYYKGTDAAAFYEAWGDIVGGIGSYPVLGNPHYHQATDLLPTINHEQVAATAQTTAATLMLLASSPSRLTDLVAERDDGGRFAVRWQASPERDIASYEILYGPPAEPAQHRTISKEPRALLEQAEAGHVVAVRAINQRGLRGWDWARTELR